MDIRGIDEGHQGSSGGSCWDTGGDESREVGVTNGRGSKHTRLVTKEYDSGSALAVEELPSPKHESQQRSRILSWDANHPRVM